MLLWDFHRAVVRPLSPEQTADLPSFQSFLSPLLPSKFSVETLNSKKPPQILLLAGSGMHLRHGGDLEALFFPVLAWQKDPLIPATLSSTAGSSGSHQSMIPNYGERHLYPGIRTPNMSISLPIKCIPIPQPRHGNPWMAFHLLHGSALVGMLGDPNGATSGIFKADEQQT